MSIQIQLRRGDATTNREVGLYWANVYKSTMSAAGKKDFRSIRLVKD